MLQFERMTQSPETELARTYRFLGVDDRFHPKTYHQPADRGSSAISKPDADWRAQLAACLGADALRVAALCPEIDLSLWRDIAGLGVDRTRQPEAERGAHPQVTDHQISER